MYRQIVVLTYISFVSCVFMVKNEGQKIWLGPKMGRYFFSKNSKISKNKKIQILSPRERKWKSASHLISIILLLDRIKIKVTH